MLSTIIIEDEKPAARRLQRILKQEGISTNVLLHSVSEAVAWFDKHQHPDLIFADIQLADGTSFDVFEQVNTNSAIIFTTAYDQFAIKAFKLNSIGYLLKPIKQDELQFAIEKFRQNNISKFVNIQQLRQQIQADKYRERFSVQYGQRIKTIATNEIACFFSENKITFIVLFSGEEFIVNDTLECIEKQVDSKYFFRINRKYIINYQAIDDMLCYSNSRIKIMLKNHKNNKLIVARERVKNFKIWLSE